jgi:hypothetical protein
MIYLYFVLAASFSTYFVKALGACAINSSRANIRPRSYFKGPKDKYNPLSLSFLPSADSKAVCQRLRKHFLTHPPSLPPSRQL